MNSSIDPWAALTKIEDLILDIQERRPLWLAETPNSDLSRLVASIDAILIGVQEEDR